MEALPLAPPEWQQSRTKSFCLALHRHKETSSRRSSVRSAVDSIFAISQS